MNPSKSLARSAFLPLALLIFTASGFAGLIYESIWSHYLKLFLGPEHLNEYAHWLRALGSPAMPETGALWIARLVLLVCVVLHIHAAYALTMMNRAARPVGYRSREYVAATYAS